MKKNKALILILLTAALVLSLLLVNKDLLHYEYTFPFSRIFTPEENVKRKYLITEAIPLKKGTYEINFAGSAEGTGSGCYIVDAGDETIFSADIPVGEITKPYTIELPSNTSIRIGISYDPDSGILEIRRIKLECSNVLYTQSILRHAIFSILICGIFIYIGFRLLKNDFAENIKSRTGIDLPSCEKVLLFLLVLTLLSSWPFLDPERFTEGDDFYFHVSRIEGMAQSLKADYFPPRILLGWMENYGVGSGFYYPDLFMFIPVILVLLGITTANALRIFLILCTFFSLLTVYLAAKNLGNGSRICGMTAASLYAFAAYRLICMFYRNAVGEVQAFIFYPLIVWGLAEILRGNVQKWKIFALGFFGLLMSHMISLAISGVLCAFFLLFYIPRLIRNKEMLMALIKAAVTTILLGAFFLLPMAEQALRNELEINVVMNKPIEIMGYNLTKFYSIFLPFDPWEFDDATMIHPYPGYALLMVPFLRLYLFFRKTEDERLKTADRILIYGLFLLIVSTDLFPWVLFKSFLAKIQFSWRFLGPASVLLCLAGGIYSDMILSSVTRKKLIAAVLLAAAVLSGMPVLIHTFNTKMYPLERLVLSNKIVSGAEYLPPDFDFFFIESNKNNIICDETQVSLSGSRRHKLGFVFSFEKEEQGEPLDYSIPLIYYYGYTAKLTDKAGITAPIPVTKDGIGLVRVSDEGLRSGTIRVAYEKTMVQKISEMISLTTLIIILFKSLRRKNRQKES